MQAQREDGMEDLRKHLRGRHLRLIAAPAAILVVIEIARGMKRFDSLRFVDHATWDVVLLALAAFFAVVLPMLYRTLFARTYREKREVAFAAFYRFEHNTIKIALYAPWVAVAASLIAVTGLMLAAILLMAAFACLNVFPSRRRLLAHARIFNVRPPTLGQPTNISPPSV